MSKIEEQGLLKTEPISIFRGKIRLYEDVSALNYYSSLCHYFVMTFIFVSVESLQPLLFQQKFSIHPSEAGVQNGYILLIDIGTKCLMAPVMGILSDKFGRVPILQIGIVTTSVSLIAMGFSESLYPEYACSRILYAVGAITLATIPFLADYVQDQTKGRAAALNVVLAALGAVFSATVITKLLTSSFSITISYAIVAGTFLILGLLYTLGLKRGLHFKLHKQVAVNVNNLSLCPFQDSPIVKELCEEDMEYIDYEKEVETLKAIKGTSWNSAIKIALLAGSNIWIFQGYITNFLGRGDSILLTLSLQIWSQQFIDPELDPDEAYRQANIKANILSGVTYTVVMVFALLYGILFEKISKNALLMAIFGLTMLGCLLMNFAPSPDSPITFVIMGILGTGMSGLYTGALYLINKYAYSEFRGYISGLANVFSVLGILTCSVLGGFLQDKWNKLAPFNLFGFMSLIGMILVVWSYLNLYRRKNNNTKQ